MSEAPALHLLVRVAAPGIGDLRVPTHRRESAMPKGFRGEPGVPNRLLQQGPQGVAQLVGMKARNPELDLSESG